MIYFIFLLAFGFGGTAIYLKYVRKTVSASVILTKMNPFHTRGDQAKPTDLLDQLVNLDGETLKRNGSYFEFYPNQKIVVFVVPPTTQIYCHCNLMQYLDLTRAIEKKIIYGVNPPKMASFEVAA